MSFYIASYVGERQRTQKVQGHLRSLGHEITVDWTAFPGVPTGERNARPGDVAAIAVRELDGIVKADPFLLLAGVPEGRAKYTELGAAIMSAVLTGKPRIYVFGEDPVHSVFFFHPMVRRMNSLPDVLGDIEDWQVLPGA
jgi:hypothetical protein